jgi:rare lipoprotein A
MFLDIIAGSQRLRVLLRGWLEDFEQDGKMKTHLAVRSLLLTHLFVALISLLMTASNTIAGSDGGPNTSEKTPNGQPGQTLSGKATFYPNSLNGRHTSSGETFHQGGHTAASNKLPLGSKVRVINPENGKSTDVKITDRGPKLGSHNIDLSKKAAGEIGLTRKEGKVPVHIEVRNKPESP